MPDDTPETTQSDMPEAQPSEAPEVQPSDDPGAQPSDEPEAQPDASDADADDGFAAVTVNGDLLAVPTGMSLGAALLLHGIRVLRRSPRDQAPRGLFCGMGVCFECLVTVDGRAGQQACRLRVRDGMAIELPEVAGDG